MVGMDLELSMIAIGETVVKGSRRRSQLVHTLALVLIVGLAVPGSRSIAATQDSWEENAPAGGGEAGGGGGGGEGDSPSGESTENGHPPTEAAAPAGTGAAEASGDTHQSPTQPEAAPATNVGEGGQEPQENAGQEAPVESPPKPAEGGIPGEQIGSVQQPAGGGSDLKDRPFAELSAADFKDATLGDKLGSGGNKDVYTVNGRDDVAIGVLKEGKSADSLDDEIALLKELEAQGLPTVEVLGTTTVNGRTAIVFKRYATGSKTVVKLEKGKVRIVGDSALLNQKSVEDLQRIRELLVTKNVKVDDLQFLIGSDGSVVIADPLDVHPGTEPSKNNLRMIDLLIQVAQGNTTSGQVSQ